MVSITKKKQSYYAYSIKLLLLIITKLLQRQQSILLKSIFKLIHKLDKVDNIQCIHIKYNIDKKQNICGILTKVLKFQKWI